MSQNEQIWEVSGTDARVDYKTDLVTITMQFWVSIKGYAQIDEAVQNAAIKNRSLQSRRPASMDSLWLYTLSQIRFQGTAVAGFL